MVCKSREAWGEILDEPLIVFVWHALLLGSICLYVDNITNPVVDEVRRELDETLL